MKAKEYLQQQRRRLEILRRDTIRKGERLEELKSFSITASNPARERIQGGRLTGDAWAVEYLDRVETARRDYLRSAVDYLELKGQIIDQIQAVEDWRHMEILWRRYVSNLQLKKIAAGMGYTYTHLERLHAEALAAFEAMHRAALEELQTPGGEESE